MLFFLYLQGIFKLYIDCQSFAFRLFPSTSSGGLLSLFPGVAKVFLGESPLVHQGCGPLGGDDERALGGSGRVFALVGEGGAEDGRLTVFGGGVGGLADVCLGDGVDCLGVGLGVDLIGVGVGCGVRSGWASCLSNGRRMIRPGSWGRGVTPPCRRMRRHRRSAACLDAPPPSLSSSPCQQPSNPLHQTWLRGRREQRPLYWAIETSQVRISCAPAVCPGWPVLDDTLGGAWDSQAASLGGGCWSDVASLGGSWWSQIASLGGKGSDASASGAETAGEGGAGYSERCSAMAPTLEHGEDVMGTPRRGVPPGRLLRLNSRRYSNARLETSCLQAVFFDCSDEQSVMSQPKVGNLLPPGRLLQRFRGESSEIIQHADGYLLPKQGRVK
ncbi:unnamed protein product [Acanthosepion pharaonis]|uniref:Uncharacterized protein n=1 Tax=Acanthosepion pharaonis TaxID=158019 RepID=A0A812C0C9_ACAPH|nr:unnamed protein product [Sepia pharaonis]